MRGVGCALAVVAALCFAAPAHAYRLDGSVFLMPIGSQTSFTSYGDVRFVNDLNQPAYDPLSGSHVVTGPQTFMSPVTGAGQYFYALSGPAQAGRCYGTSLTASVNPAGMAGPYEAMWSGSTVCADPSGGGNAPPDNQNDGDEPMILDLNGDGVWTSNVDDQPVWFDLDGDGCTEATGWTASGHDDAFLYVDRNGNRVIDDGRELFGNATLLPDGSTARHGYEALAAYDRPEYGGNGDGSITHADAIFVRLRLWVDRNHDARDGVDETYTLAESGVVAISLRYSVAGPAENYGRDANGNLHLVRGHYIQRTRGELHENALHEVFFRTRGCA